ncbi:MAG: DUF805 domain-containing protein [Thermoguttaceae bacterium]|nr:DUF805 domain-containing protein [Thermoguttaceae bacterium]
MSFCPYCGAESGGGNYCASCGAQLATDGAENPYAVGTQAVGAGENDSVAPEIPGFSRALNICLKEKYACFKGRASRSEFWWFFLGAFLAGMGLVMIASGLAGALSAASGKTGGIIPILLILGFWLYLLVPSWAVGVRRYHDVGLSGWIYFILAMIATCLSVATQSIANEEAQALLTGAAAPEKPGWYDLAQTAIFLIGFFNLIIFVKRGKPDPNKYGPAPVKRAK